MFYARPCYVWTFDSRYRRGRRSGTEFTVMIPDPDRSDDADAPASDSFRRPLYDGGELSVDAAFKLLGNRRRRYVLYYLADVDGPAGRDELARRIATWETDADVDDVPTDLVRRVIIALEHAHLPRLEEDGAVTYDRETRAVTATDAMARLKPFLDLARESDFD